MEHLNDQRFIESFIFLQLLKKPDLNKQTKLECLSLSITYIINCLKSQETTRMMTSCLTQKHWTRMKRFLGTNTLVLSYQTCVHSSGRSKIFLLLNSTRMIEL